MPKDQKAEMVRRLLYWADDVGVPNNSQIREILAGLMRTLTQEWMTDTKSAWKILTKVPPRSENESSASAKTDNHGSENESSASAETENMRFS